jgi:D-tyrosyl-tRNA(Tyr) deacylase
LRLRGRHRKCRRRTDPRFEELRAVVQRVARASVRVGGETVAQIGSGLLVLVAVRRGDDAAAAAQLAGKTARLRIFENESGKFDRSVVDVGGDALVVSQFTLLADTSKGNRPSFTEAAPPEKAAELYDVFCEALRALGVSVATGVFGARMEVELVNDGPVTLVL